MHRVRLSGNYKESYDNNVVLYFSIVEELRILIYPNHWNTIKGKLTIDSIERSEVRSSMEKLVKRIPQDEKGLYLKEIERVFEYLAYVNDFKKTRCSNSSAYANQFTYAHDYLSEQIALHDAQHPVECGVDKTLSKSERAVEQCQGEAGIRKGNTLLFVSLFKATNMSRSRTTGKSSAGVPSGNFFD